MQGGFIIAFIGGWAQFCFQPPRVFYTNYREGKLRTLMLAAALGLMIAAGCGTPIEGMPDPGNLIAHRGHAEGPLYFEVTGSTSGAVWGTDIFTDDSNLATAAVHAGVLADGEAGVVKVNILPGQDGYQGSESNGVTSWDYGTWSGSYSVEKI
jgi:hypothetical protein